MASSDIHGRAAFTAAATQLHLWIKPDRSIRLALVSIPHSRRRDDPPIGKAILYRHVGAFKESLAIRDAFSVQIRHHPIVAFETSLIFWALWRLWDCADVLRDALDWADCNNSRESNGPRIYTLLRATLGLTEIYNKGDFTQAQDSLVEIRTWLLTTPVDECNDLQVCHKIQSTYRFTILWTMCLGLLSQSLLPYRHGSKPARGHVGFKIHSLYTRCSERYKRPKHGPVERTSSVARPAT